MAGYDGIASVRVRLFFGFVVVGVGDCAKIFRSPLVLIPTYR